MLHFQHVNLSHRERGGMRRHAPLPLFLSFPGIESWRNISQAYFKRNCVLPITVAQSKLAPEYCEAIQM